MELIIKPTGICNFNCEFCSAANIKTFLSINKVPYEIEEIIKYMKPTSVIITGGEPLCVNPEYYENLLSITNCNISLTTNLKDFANNPNKWKDILNHKRIKIMTSFQYGNKRKWNKNNIYDEQSFLCVVEMCRKYLNITPAFISVIDNENEIYAMNHVYLAERLNTQCRLNNAYKTGRQSHYYPYYKIFKLWINIIKEGYEDYVINCIEREKGNCGINSNLMCQSSIRAIYLDENRKIIYSNCEEVLNLGLKNYYINDIKKDIDINNGSYLKTNIEINDLIHKKCLYCELNRICNGCKIQRHMIKNYSPEHCENMIKLKDDILKHGWKL